MLHWVFEYFQAWLVKLPIEVTSNGVLKVSPNPLKSVLWQKQPNHCCWSWTIWTELNWLVLPKDSYSVIADGLDFIVNGPQQLASLWGLSPEDVKQVLRPLRRRLVVARLKMIKSFGDRLMPFGSKGVLESEFNVRPMPNAVGQAWCPNGFRVQKKLLHKSTVVYLKILKWSEKGSCMFLFRHDLWDCALFYRLAVAWKGQQRASLSQSSCVALTIL